MNRLKNLVTLFSTAIILIVSIESNASAQMLLNEVEADPPSEVSEGCQYVELRGTPGSTVPAGTWFLSVDGGAGNFGNVSSPVNLSGMQFGSNGTITIASTSFNECVGRAFPSGTTLVDSQSFFGFGIDTESYLLVSAPVAGMFVEGDDIDQNNDRVIDPSFSITVIDGISTIVNITAQAAYAPIVFQGDVNQPDAFTRFSGNNNPLSAAAWYYGELAATPDNTTVYAAPLSPNFPTGGALTPGAPNVPQQTTPRTLFDFDGDGRADQSVVRNGLWYINRSSNSQLLAIQWGIGTDRLAPADYDGDGITDLAIWRPDLSTSAFWIRHSSTGAVQTEVFGQPGDIVISGDWDGDSKADVAVYREAASAGAQSFFYYRRSSNNPSGNITFVPFGTNGDKAVRGDFDGDGKLDAAVYRNDGTWHILQSSNSQYRVLLFGLPGDRPVAADYSGDGKADLALFRPSNGVWHILSSSDGTVRFQPFGAATDVLVPADYDGDGRADVAVWRNGTWIILQSSNGNVSFSQFGQAGDIAVPSTYIQ